MLHQYIWKFDRRTYSADYIKRMHIWLYGGIVNIVFILLVSTDKTPYAAYKYSVSNRV